MQVKRMMLLGIALALGLVLGHQLVAETMEHQRENLDEVQLVAGRVARDAAGLLVLTQDYLLHRSRRAERQWRAVHAELGEALESLDGTTLDIHDDINQLRDVTRSLPTLFSELQRNGTRDSTDEGQARVEMLSDHLVAETRRISDGAFSLASHLIELRNEQVRRLRAVTLAVNLSLSALLLGLVALVLRRVLKPMNDLQLTARRIEAGDLDARSNYRTDDEFGALSQRFDAMAKALQERQVALEATRRDLRTVLDAVPSMIGYWDSDLVNRVANRAYHQCFGVEPGALPGLTMLELLGPELFEADRPHVEAVLRGEPQAFEQTLRGPDNADVRHTLTHYLPDRDEHGNVRGFYVIAHDVSELTKGRRWLAEALRDNQALLDAIQSYALFSELDAEGRIVQVSDSVCHLTGFSREELLGHTYAIHRATANGRTFDSEVWPRLQAGQAWSGEICGSAKDGTPYWTHAVMAPVKDANGMIRKFVSIRTDITVQRRMAADIERFNKRFELAASAAGIGVWEYDVRAGTLVWDDRMFSLYGRTRSAAAEPYTMWSESVHSDDKPRSEQALNEALTGGRPFDTQFRIVRPDGEVRHLKAAALVVRDAAELPERMIGVNIDITNRMRAEAALRASESLLRRVGRLANVGGWRVELAAGKVYWNEQTRAIHEVPDDFEPTLDSAIEFYAPEGRGVIAEAIHRGISSGEGWDLELRFITYTGRTIWVRAMGEVECEESKPVRLVGALQDVTERRRTDDLLRASTSAAEAANAAKSVFLANMSHEIRTPLNAIIGVTHLLVDTPLDTEQRALVRQAQLAGSSLLGIVNDVLDLAKIEAGEVTLDETGYAPAIVLTELETVYGHSASAKGLALVVERSPNLPDWLVGDRGKLLQMLTNLVSNAIKFTERGSVSVRLEVVDDGETSCRLMASVRDTGIGIEPEAQSRLFAPFVQADSTTTRRHGGSGLGLSIVKRLASMMGGEAGFTSEVGIGSEFWFAVPQRRPATGDTVAPETSAATLEVLVVDANDTARLQLTSQVRALGWRAVALDSGDALLREIERRISERRPQPDALLVAWQMPDGLQTLAKLSAHLPSGSLPISLLVSADEATQVKLRDIGHLADHVLTKPVTASVLFNAINLSVSKRLGSTDRVLRATRLDASDARWLSGIRVLLVDDSDINLDVARRLLERQGAIVQPCRSGIAALAMLRRTGHETDAVLMDVQMPGLDGLETTRRLRGELGLNNLPVIALTAGALMEERRRAIDAGMDDFLTKPIDPAQLVRTLRRMVESRRGAAMPVIDTEPGPFVPDWATIEGIDVEDAVSRLGGDVPLFRSLLERMISEFADLARPFPPDAAGHIVDADRLMARLHKLRGSAGTLGARGVQQLAAEGEESLHDSGRVDPRVMERLAATLQQIGQSVQAHRPRNDEVGPIGMPPTAEDLTALSELLRQRSLGARARAQALAAGLRVTLGADATERLLRSIDELKYGQALAELAPLLEQAVVAHPSAG